VWAVGRTSLRLGIRSWTSRSKATYDPSASHDRDDRGQRRKFFSGSIAGGKGKVCTMLRILKFGQGLGIQTEDLEVKRLCS
jgi:hypothetical protein